MTEFTSNDYMNVLRRLDLHPYQRRMLEIHYHALEHTVTAPQMAKAMGYRNWGGANLHYGVLFPGVGPRQVSDVEWNSVELTLQKGAIMHVGGAKKQLFVNVYGESKAALYSRVHLAYHPPMP